MSNYLNIGKIVNTHGLKGHVKVYPYTNQLTDFESFKSVFLDPSLTKRLQVTQVKYQQAMVILKFKDYNHINEVLPLKEQLLYVDKDQLAADLADDEYFIDDLIGMQVVDQNQRACGEITGYRETTQQVVLEITHQGRQWFLPFVDAFIVAVDHTNQQLVVNLIEGLFNED